MDNHTAPELLEAVGVDWRDKYGRIVCAECGMTWRSNDTDRVHFSACRRPSNRDLPLTYTGPALGTPELDALLLVAGQRWLVAHQSDTPALNAVMTGLANQYGPKTLPFDESERLTHYKGKVQVMLRLLLHDLPGHALARAIKEVAA